MHCDCEKSRSENNVRTRGALLNHWLPLPFGSPPIAGHVNVFDGSARVPGGFGKGIGLTPSTPEQPAVLTTLTNGLVFGLRNLLDIRRSRAAQ